MMQIYHIHKICQLQSYQELVTRLRCTQRLSNNYKMPSIYKSHLVSLIRIKIVKSTFYVMLAFKGVCLCLNEKSQTLHPCKINMINMHFQKHVQ